jgi:hypothetical protein
MSALLDELDRVHCEGLLAAGVPSKGYVQLVSWFSDVWARILDVSMPLGPADAVRFTWIHYICYDKYGRARRRRSARLGDVRRFSDSRPDASVLHDLEDYIGAGGHVHWPTAAHSSMGWADQHLKDRRS